MSLERIVRSFQLPDVAPPKRVIDPTRDDTDTENAILVVGKGGTVAARSLPRRPSRPGQSWSRDAPVARSDPPSERT